MGNEDWAGRDRPHCESCSVQTGLKEEEGEEEGEE